MTATNEPESPESADKDLQELIDVSIKVIDPLIMKIKAKYRDKAMQGRMTCPMCKVKHALKVVQILHRGHGRIRMFCDTENCIRLME